MSAQYIPDRNHVVWLDFEPTKGKEIGKYRPTFVLSTKEYNKKTGLLICCPISTSIRNAPTEVPLDCLKTPSVIAASIVQTLSWENRKIKFITKEKKTVLIAVLERLLPLIGTQIYLDE